MRREKWEVLGGVEMENEGKTAGVGVRRCRDTEDGIGSDEGGNGREWET